MAGVSVVEATIEVDWLEDGSEDVAAVSSVTVLVSADPVPEDPLKEVVGAWVLETTPVVEIGATVVSDAFVDEEMEPVATELPDVVEDGEDVDKDDSDDGGEVEDIVDCDSEDPVTGEAVDVAVTGTEVSAVSADPLEFEVPAEEVEAVLLVDVEVFESSETVDTETSDVSEVVLLEDRDVTLSADEEVSKTPDDFETVPEAVVSLEMVESEDAEVNVTVSETVVFGNSEGVMPPEVVYSEVTDAVEAVVSPVVAESDVPESNKVVSEIVVFGNPEAVYSEALLDVRTV